MQSKFVTHDTLMILSQSNYYQSIYISLFKLDFFTYFSLLVCLSDQEENFCQGKGNPYMEVDEEGVVVVELDELISWGYLGLHGDSGLSQDFGSLHYYFGWDSDKDWNQDDYFVYLGSSTCCTSFVDVDTKIVVATDLGLQEYWGVGLIYCSYWEMAGSSYMACNADYPLDIHMEDKGGTLVILAYFEDSYCLVGFFQHYWNPFMPFISSFEGASCTVETTNYDRETDKEGNILSVYQVDFLIVGFCLISFAKEPLALVVAVVGMVDMVAFCSVKAFYNHNNMDMVYYVDSASHYYHQESCLSKNQIVQLNSLNYHEHLSYP